MMAKASRAGCPLRIVDQRVQPSQPGTASMAAPSNSQMIANVIRLRAPGCTMPASLDGELAQLGRHLAARVRRCSLRAEARGLNLVPRYRFIVDA